jgi:hypothetical protein
VEPQKGGWLNDPYALKGIDFKHGDFEGFFQGQENPKTIFSRNGQASGIIPA